MKIYDTIIIGGGMSGIGCARTLLENGHSDFLMVTKDIGGRVQCSEDGLVNYGAYYARKDYKHVMPFLRLRKQKLNTYTLSFFIGKDRRTFFDIRNFPHIFSLLRLIAYLLNIYWRYRRLQKRMQYMQQKDAVAADPVLQKEFYRFAPEVIKELKAEYWAHYFINPCCWSTGFIDMREASALDMAICLFPIFIPTHEFVLHREKMIQPFFEQIEMDEVTDIEKDDDHWVVKTEKGKHHHARHVVLATPIHISKKLASIPEETNPAISVHLAHIRGNIKEEYKDYPYDLLSPYIKDIVVTQEPNGTFLFYSHDKDYDLHEYFEDFEIICKKYWHPCFYLGNKMIENDREENFTLIGDHNFFGMEDAYICGIYGANRVLKKTI